MSFYQGESVSRKIEQLAKRHNKKGVRTQLYDTDAPEKELRKCAVVYDPAWGWKYPPRMEIATFLYVIRCDEYVKIGVSKNPQDRFRTIATSSPHEMEMVSAFAIPPSDRDPRYLEEAIHLGLARYHKRGEWFHVGCLEHFPDTSTEPQYPAFTLDLEGIPPTGIT